MAYLHMGHTDGYMIQPVRFGGYVVYGPAAPDCVQPIVFVGSLDDCLAHVRTILQTREASARGSQHLPGV